MRLRRLLPEAVGHTHVPERSFDRTNRDRLRTSGFIFARMRPTVRAEGLTHGSLKNATSLGITWPGASSMSQCPDPVTMTPSTLLATIRPCEIEKSPPDFSPPEH